MGARTWTLTTIEPPPAPPRPVEQILIAEGLVDPLLQALLPAVLRGDTQPVRGPKGGWWRVTGHWDGDRLHVAAVDTTDQAAADRALAVARRLRDLATPESILAAAGPHLQVAVGSWTLDSQGALTLAGLEQQAVREAMSGRVVHSPEGWGAVPLVVDGRPFGVLLGPAGDRGEAAELEALAVVVAVPLARALGIGRATEAMSHALRTPLNAILGYVDLLIEGGGRPDDLLRIRSAAESELMQVDAWLGQEAGRRDGRGVKVSLAEILVVAVASVRGGDPGAEVVQGPAEGVVIADRSQLEQAVAQLIAGRTGGPRRVEAGVGEHDYWFRVWGGDPPGHGHSEASARALGGRVIHGRTASWLRLPLEGGR